MEENLSQPLQRVYLLHISAEERKNNERKKEELEQVALAQKPLGYSHGQQHCIFCFLH